MFFKNLKSAFNLIFFLWIAGFVAINAQKKEEFDWNKLDQYVEKEFGKIIKGTDLAKKVENIGNEVARWAYVGDQKLSFKLIDNDEPNAFAFPNGNIYVLTGLFKTIDSDNELAFVLAHEISHVLLKHGEKSQEYQQRFNVNSDDHKMKAFTREQEYEADTYGILYSLRAGYSPLGSVNWFNKMTSLGYEYPPLYVDYSDHPNFTQRVVKAFINIGNYYEYAKNFDYGLLYLSMGNWKEAAQSFEKFLEKYPHYKEAYNNIGVALFAQKISAKNVELDLWLSTAVSKVQLFANNFDKPVRGKYALTQRDFADAVNYFEKAINYDSKYVQPYINLALISAFTGDYSKSQKYLDQAMKFDSKSYDAFIAKGFILAEQNRFADASKAFQDAIRLDPNNPQGYFNLAYTYQWNKQNDLARNAWNDFLKLMPSGDYSNKAKENLAQLNNESKKDYSDKSKKENQGSKVPVRPSLAGISIGDDMNKVRQVLKVPSNKKSDDTGEIWEYSSPDISIGFNKKGLVDYVMVFSKINSGVEYIKNVNVGATEGDIVVTFGRPEQTFWEGAYLVYNYKSMGVAFWTAGGSVVGIAIYNVD